MPKIILERLTKRSEFLKVGKTDKRCVKPAFIVQALRREADGVCRYGLTASRKIGGAIERNRAKRRMRALVSEVLPNEGRGGFDYVLIARRAALSRNFSEMLIDLKEALRSLHAKEN